jgi:hypothetical protein
LILNAASLCASVSFVSLCFLYRFDFGFVRILLFTSSDSAQRSGAAF